MEETIGGDEIDLLRLDLRISVLRMARPLGRERDPRQDTAAIARGL
jgi:hypothetical protein